MRATRSRPALDALEREISLFAEIERLDAAQFHELCPFSKTTPFTASLIATVSGSIPMRCFRAICANFAEMAASWLRARASGESKGDAIVGSHDCEGRSLSAGVLVNAAGAWADSVAQLAGASPIGLQPMRRTIITFDAPEGTDLEHLPFAKTVGDGLYFAPESGRLFASPMDEVPTEPSDAQPDEMEVALAAFRMEERTIVKVDRIHSRWAGLRTFTPDRRPAVGFAPELDGFFWLAGQGGFGLQTSPAVARIAAALILGSDWPQFDVSAEELSPVRFFRQTAEVDPPLGHEVE